MPHFLRMLSFLTMFKIVLYSSLGLFNRFFAKSGLSTWARTNNQLIAARTSPKSVGSVDVAALANVSRTSLIVRPSKLAFVTVSNSNEFFKSIHAVHCDWSPIGTAFSVAFKYGRMTVSKFKPLSPPRPFTFLPS